MEIQPLIVVRDVQASSRWYQDVLGLASAHGGPEYERLTAAGGDPDGFLLQLHRLESEEHPGLFDPARPPGANGVALWFRTEGFDGVVARAQAAGAEVVNGPLYNERAGQRELWLRDLDGYLVVVASHMGDAPGRGDP